MAAITGGIERAVEAYDDFGPEVTGGQQVATPGGQPQGALGALGATRASAKPLSSTHPSLTKTHWVRSAMEWYLSKCTFRHEWDGQRLILRVLDSPAKVKSGNKDIAIVPQNAVPWARGGSAVHKVSVWSEGNSKMDCPVYDLPAGGTDTGGSCPGANAGQTVIDPGVRARAIARLAAMGTQVQPEKTICQSCYAEGGSYAYADMAARLILRMWWTQAMVSKHFDSFVDVMFRSALLLKYPAGAPDGILPIRLHSSGDFYSPRYAEAWIEIADRLATDGGAVGKRIRFWAPTRTWAATEEWDRFWAERLPRMKSRNLMVRSSSYHFDDPAPGALAEGNAKGSTSVFITDRAAALTRTNFHATAEEKALFDWTCPTYSQLKSEQANLKSCTASPNPRGSSHCRACWVAPELRINYPAH